MPCFTPQHVPGLRINYSRLGEGDPCILIHGMATNLGFWHIALLNRLSAFLDLVVYDLRGHGRSTMPKSGYRPMDMAGDLRALMDHLGIKSAHLVGHSFGGEVALECCAEFPERVLSLALIDCRITPLQPHHSLRTLPGCKRLVAQLKRLGIDIDLDEDGAGLLLLEAAARPEVQQALAAMKDKSHLPFQGEFVGSRAARQWKQLLDVTTARDDLRSGISLTEADFHQWLHPLLAMYGEHSQCRPTYDALTERVPDLHAILIPQGDHFFPTRHPNRVADALLQFHEAMRNPKPACLDLKE